MFLCLSPGQLDSPPHEPTNPGMEGKVGLCRFGLFRCLPSDFTKLGQSFPATVGTNSQAARKGGCQEDQVPLGQPSVPPNIIGKPSIESPALVCLKQRSPNRGTRNTNHSAFRREPNIRTRRIHSGGAPLRRQRMLSARHGCPF